MYQIWLAPLISILIAWSLTTHALENQESRLEESIAVESVVADNKIEQRLSEILAAMGSFRGIKVKVHSGVVLLTGKVDREDQNQWVTTLASRLDGVVAVQSHIGFYPKDIFDLSPAQKEVEDFKIAFVRYLPAMGLAVAVLLISIVVFFLISAGFRKAFSKQIVSPLLLNATARMLSLPILLLGLYLALNIGGLTGLAITVLGGTGVLGLVVGLGLKSSFEDYSASILLSIKKPFRPSDWVRIGSFEGIVQAVTSRSTLLIDFAGNHILMPNNLVYKSIVTNITANPKMRCDFTFGLDYQDSLETAQKVVLSLLASISFVLKDPEPWVLLDELGASAVKMRVYYWLNVREVSSFKMTSFIMLEVKNHLMANGFHFPDPQREIVFTNQLNFSQETPLEKAETDSKFLAMRSPHLNEVRAESAELDRQARESDLPDQGENIL